MSFAKKDKFADLLKENLKLKEENDTLKMKLVDVVQKTKVFEHNLQRDLMESLVLY